MKKNLILLMTLCLFALYACQQQNINPTTLVEEYYELADKKREAPCDLTQIPLYIPPASNVPNGTIDFSVAFPVTESTGYENANGVNLTVQNISYSVNGFPLIGSQFTYLNNTNYILVIDVTYTDGFVVDTETFSLTFNVSLWQTLEWGKTNSCLYDDKLSNGGGKNAIKLKTVQSVILPDL